MKNKLLLFGIILSALFILSPNKADASIAYSASANTAPSTYGGNWSYNITPTGTSSYVIAVADFYARNGLSDCPGEPTATYNGQAMTQIKSAISYGSNGKTAMFAFPNGTADGSAHAIAISYGGANCELISSTAAAYNGVMQVISTASSSSSGADTVSVTTTKAGSWVVGGSGYSYSSAGTNTSQRTIDSGNRVPILESALDPVSSLSSVTLTANFSNASYKELFALELKNESVGANFLTGGSCTASNVYSGQVCGQAVDGNTATAWIPHNNNVNQFPEWWRYDLGAGVTKKINKILFSNYYNRIATADVQGSNDDSTWTTIGSLSTTKSTPGQWESFYYPTSTTAYRYHRINITSGYASPDLYGTNIGEILAFEEAPAAPTSNKRHFIGTGLSR